jgi:hypothetical protein
MLIQSRNLKSGSYAGNHYVMLGALGRMLLNPGEVYAQRGLPGQVALGVNGGIADGFSFRDSHGAYRFWGELELTRYNRNHSYWNL